MDNKILLSLSINRQSENASDVSMVTLQTQPGPVGQQMVITPKGMLVPLPGAGVDGPAVHVYMGGQGGFWYVDKNDQQVDLTPAVRMLQGSASQAQPTAPIPQYAPVQQTTYASQPTSSSNAGGTAAAAGLGAMAGAAMMSSANSGWGTVPYGTPVHYGAGAAPYYNHGGQPVYINNSNNAALVNQGNTNYAANMQQQQSYYKQQQLQQGATWKNWQQPTSNPFVSSEYQQGYGQTAAHYGANQGAQAAEYGQAAGQAAQHYGVNQGEQAGKRERLRVKLLSTMVPLKVSKLHRKARTEGEAAKHYGQSQGENAARFGAADGAEKSEGGRRGKFSGRSAEGAGQAEEKR